jgi:hypothetical protein
MSEVKNFKVGQVWLTRSGEELTIESVEGESGKYPIVVRTGSDSCYTFPTSGYFYGKHCPSNLDLIELVADTPESEALTQTFEMKTTQRDRITVDIHFESGNEYSCIKHNENGKPYEIKLRKNGEHGGYEITFDSLEEMKVIANAMLKMCDQS